MGRSRIARTMKEKKKAMELESASSSTEVLYDKLGASKYASKSFSLGGLVRSSNSKELDGVIYEIDRLNWINCDRYFPFPQSYITQEVDRKGLEDFHFLLFFKKVKGIIGCRVRDNRFVFLNTPPAQKCVLVGYTVENKSARFLTYEFETSTMMLKPDIPTRQLSISEFETELKRFNRIWN